MAWQLLGLLVLLGVFSGCGKHYWEAPGRGVNEPESMVSPPTGSIARV